MFYNVYQPIVLNASVFSYEALIRLRAGNVNLNDYLTSVVNKPLFDYQQIIRILLENKENDSLLFINIYPQSLLDEDFISKVLLLKSFYHRFVLEIIESDCECMEKLCSNVNLLRSHGLEFALDDFGAHFSNISRLNSLNVKYIKIDRALVSSIDTDFLSFSFLLTTCQLLSSERPECHIIIEGIETAKQHQLLSLIENYTGVTLFRQGYYYAYPKTDIKLKTIKHINNKSDDIGLKGIDYNIESIIGIKKLYQKFTDDDNFNAALSEINSLKILSSKAVIDLCETLEKTPYMVILKNESGDIIYNNQCSRDSFGISSISLLRDEWVKYRPELKICLTNDREFILSGQQSSTRLEMIGNMEFLVNRYLIKKNDTEADILSIIVLKENVHLENYDVLTGFCLRQDYLRYNDIEFVVFLDLDGLKHINDNVSYEKGDELIYSFAQSIKTVFSSEDYICIRHGGDEFIILCKSKDLDTIESNLTLLTNVNIANEVYFSYGLAINSDNILDSISISSRRMKEQKIKNKRHRLN